MAPPSPVWRHRFPSPTRQDQATLRDEAAYETDYAVNHYIAALFTFHYQDERALDAIPTIRQTLGRTNLVFAGSLRGEIKHRVFYEGSGNVTHSSLSGFAGTPRLGLTYVPVLPGAHRLKGTSLQLTLASGNRERSLPEQSQSILTPARSRTLDVSADQNLYRRKLILHAGYFHNQFSHQSEVLSLAAPAAGIGPTLSSTQAFRTQGFTSELRYQPLSRVSIAGGYTYLASLVERSAAAPPLQPRISNSAHRRNNCSPRPAPLPTASPQWLLFRSVHRPQFIRRPASLAGRSGGRLHLQPHTPPPQPQPRPRLYAA